MDSTTQTPALRMSVVGTLAAVVWLAWAGPMAPLAAAQGAGPITGLWHTVLTTSDGSIFDIGFQQFNKTQAGFGTESMISAGVPPTIGNVCMGAWKRDADGTVRLRHVTWNWNGDEEFGDAPTGHFLLEMTVRASTDGKTYTGTWKAASFDDYGDTIPQADSEFEGTVDATRIGVR